MFLSSVATAVQSGVLPYSELVNKRCVIVALAHRSGLTERLEKKKKISLYLKVQFLDH